MLRIRIVPFIMGCAGLLGCSESPAAPTQAVSPIAAATVAECDAGIDAVRSAVGGVTFLSRQAAKDEAGLLTKLDAAQAKLDEGKFEDAVQKLIDFKNAVIALRDAGKPKMSAEDAQTLLDAADAAIACIGGIG